MRLWLLIKFILKKPWIKVVLAISLDGKIAISKGDKNRIGGIGDREVLEDSLAWSDAIIMGGGTLRAHRNTCLIHKSNLIQERIKQGRQSQPISLVVSNQENYSINWPFFKQPIKRWLISSNNHSTGYERLIPMHKNWSETLSKLSEEGLSRLVLLGGAKLVSSFLKEDQIDELQLTFTPKLIGGDQSWIPIEKDLLPSQLSNFNSWRLKETKILVNSELLLIYVRIRN